MIDDRLKAVAEEIVRLAPTIDPVLVSSVVAANVRSRVSADQLIDHRSQHPDLWTSGSGAPPVVQRIVHALNDAGADQFVMPCCDRCHRPRPLHYVHNGERVCSACRARLTAKACCRCGLVKPVAVTLPEGPICAKCRVNDPESWEDCVVCANTFAVAIRDESGAAICRRCYRAPKRTCDECGELREIRSNRNGRSLCDDCCTSSHRRCGNCGRVGPIRRRANAEHPDLCDRCCPLPRVVCVACGREGARGRRSPTGGYWCRTCTPKQQHICSICGRLRPTAVRRDGGVCPSCYAKQRTSECGQCAQIDHLYLAGLCQRCSLKKLLGELMGPAGTEPEGFLHPVYSELVNGPFPHSVLGWLRRSNGGPGILAGLAGGEIPPTHEGLDQVGGKVADFVRSMLTATGVLPERNSDVVRFESWLNAYIGGRPEEHKSMLRQFSNWVVLRRLRRTPGVVLTDGQHSNAREEIRQPARLLEWLAEQRRTLSELDQTTMDAWLADGATSRRRVRPFLLWAQQQNLVRSDLRLPRLSGGNPITPAATDDRWAQVTRLLHDDTIELQTRVAGLLVLLYGQQVSRVSMLTHQCITVDEHGTTIRFGRTPVRLPPDVDHLVVQLRDRRQGTSVQPAQRRWLFTGKLPGLPIKAGRLHLALNKLGIACTQQRQAALLELAIQLPAPVIADLLDVHPVSAARWKQLGQGDWASYVAHRATAVQPTGTPALP